MPSCHEMKKGEIYTCQDCDLELQVIKECTDVGKPQEECGCHVKAAACTFSCCGKDLVKKQS